MTRIVNFYPVALIVAVAFLGACATPPMQYKAPVSATPPTGHVGVSQTVTIFDASGSHDDEFPDGKATLESVVADLPEPGASMEQVCKAGSHGSLMGARGNSGVIMSQILRGLSAGMKDHDQVDGPTFSAALTDAATASSLTALMSDSEDPVLLRNALGPILDALSNYCEKTTGYPLGDIENIEASDPADLPPATEELSKRLASRLCRAVATISFVGHESGKLALILPRDLAKKMTLPVAEESAAARPIVGIGNKADSGDAICVRSCQVDDVGIDGHCCSPH